MNITIQITHSLSPEVIELFKGFLNGHTPESKEPVAKKEKAPMKSVPASTSSETSTDKAEVKEGTKQETLSLETVRALMNEKAQLGDKQRNQVKSVLEEMGVKKFTDLAAVKYSDFWNELKKIA